MDRGRLIFTIPPTEGQLRNSEGDMIRLKDGSILMVYGRYHGDSAADLAPCDLVTIVSKDEGETWSEPRPLLNAADFGVVNLISVSLTRLQDGGIGIFFNCPFPGKGWKRHKYFGRSYDEGETFGGFVECSSELYDCRSGINNSRMVRLSSGRLIYPHSIHAGCEKTQEEGKRTVSPTSHTCGNFIYSDDDGYTWRTSEDMIYMPFTQTIPGIQEGEIIEIKPNVLKCFFRTDKCYQYQSISLDGGDHWSLPHPSCFTSPTSPISIRKNPYSGKTYAFWNPIPKYNDRKGIPAQFGRSPLVVAETDDTVSRILKLEYVHSDLTKAYCYIAPMFLNEKEAIIAYGNGDSNLGEKSLQRLAVSKVDLDF